MVKCCKTYIKIVITKQLAPDITSSKYSHKLQVGLHQIYIAQAESQHSMSATETMNPCYIIAYGSDKCLLDILSKFYYQAIFPVCIFTVTWPRYMKAF